MTTDLSQFRFGARYTLDGGGAIFILESYSRSNNEPRMAHVRFACDWRNMSFPIELSRLRPIPETEPRSIH